MKSKIKEKPKLSSLIVTQANELVESRYNLTLGEQRLIFTMISRIQPGDEDFKPYKIRLNELAGYLGINKNHIYSDCKKITKKLLRKVVEIQEEGRLLQTHWVSSADYIDGTGVVNLTFDPLLKPYLLKLKGNFTSSKLDMLLSFKSQYTMRMYTLLKQYERLKKRELDISVLRSMLGIREDQYKRYNDFKKGILEPSKKELKFRSDIYFEFDEIKHGRKICAIRFRIISNTPASNKNITVSNLPLNDNQDSSLLAKLMHLVPDQHRIKKTVISALKTNERKHGFDYVKRNILYSNTKADRSYAGFLNKSLKEDWGYDWELDKKSVVKKKPVEIWKRNGFNSEKEYNDAMYHKQMETYGK